MFPEYRVYYTNAINARMKKGFFADFKDANDVFEWWISQNSKKVFFSTQRFCMDG